MPSDPSTPGLQADELDREAGESLPAREVMSLVSPTSGTSVLPGLTADTGTATAGSTATGASTLPLPAQEDTYDSSTSSTATG